MANQIAVEVPPELDGARVDKALAATLGVSRAAARSLVERGVTLDGVVVRPADKVRAGAELVAPKPDQRPRLRAEKVPFDVLYEDEALAVVDKPAGVVVHPGSGQTVGTLAAGLLDRYPELAGVGQPDRWGLVHRLDKGTSGALIVARTPGSHAALTEMIKRRQVRRLYLALVSGLFSAPTGTIDAPIGRDPTRPTRRATIHGGKPAVTHYEVSRAFPRYDCTLLEVRLDTGRTHQIRVHLSVIGHPLIGDETYGGQTPLVRSPRVFLHASRVEFRHPSTGLALSIEAPLPDDLRSVLSSLEA